MVVDVVVVIASIYVVGDWLAGACAAVLLLVWRMLPKDEGPPVLALALTAQWMQVSIGVFYGGLTGRPLNTMLMSDYRPMVLIGLGCVVMLTLGLSAGQRLTDWSISPREVSRETVAGMPALLGVYVGALAVTVAMQEIAFRYPTFTQAILALSFARLALVALLLRRFIRQDQVQWHLVLALLGFEVALGFTGYFSGFKEPVVLAALAILEVFDRRRVGHWATGAALIGFLLVASVMWMGVRGEFRQEFQDEVFATSRSARLSRVQALATDWFSRREEGSTFDELDELVDRGWAIYYPALAVTRVPSILPYTDGQLIKDTFVHLVSPRILFPDKPDLPSDSEMVRKYSGVYVAGPEQQTSIAFGYAAESYVDFGMPVMFVPVLLFGVVMGIAYRWFLRVIVHRELAVALVTCIFWINLYLFERSWTVTLGFAFTMMIYLGLVAFIVDRWLMMRAMEHLPRGGDASAAA